MAMELTEGGPRRAGSAPSASLIVRSCTPGLAFGSFVSARWLIGGCAPALSARRGRGPSLERERGVGAPGPGESPAPALVRKEDRCACRTAAARNPVRPAARSRWRTSSRMPGWRPAGNTSGYILI
jgi:hypothetical protein